MSLVDTGRTPEAVNLLHTTLNDLGVRLSGLSEEWIQQNQDVAMAAGQEAVTAIEEARRNGFLVTIIALLLTGLLGFLTLRRIIVPIRALDTSVKTIAAGDYAQEVPFTTAQDETGGLASCREPHLSPSSGNGYFRGSYPCLTAASPAFITLRKTVDCSAESPPTAS